jgi:hypothetical protein
MSEIPHWAVALREQLNTIAARLDADGAARTQALGVALSQGAEFVHGEALVDPYGGEFDTLRGMLTQYNERLVLLEQSHADKLDLIVGLLQDLTTRTADTELAQAGAVRHQLLMGALLLIHTGTDRLALRVLHEIHDANTRLGVYERQLVTYGPRLEAVIARLGDPSLAATDAGRQMAEAAADLVDHYGPQAAKEGVSA